MFTAWVHDDPLALRLQATKVRSIRAAFAKGATWECQEATQTVAKIEDATRPKRKSASEQERDERAEALGKALSEEPQSDYTLAKRTGVPRTTIQRLLDDVLLPAGNASKVEGGWVARSPISRGRATGLPGGERES
jgi:hypothetical protein